MDDPDGLRAAIARAYARAITADPAEAEAGEAAPARPSRIPGYSWLQVATLPREALTSSFGCGNPAAHADLREGHTVLDLGCGAGVDLILAAHAVGPTGLALGLDMTVPMVARAQANAAAAQLGNVAVLLALVEAVPLRAASVDRVISNCALSLSPEKPRVFAEIARVLKPGGRVVLCDVLARELPRWARESPGLRASCLAGALSEPEYAGALHSAGLEQIEVPQRIEYEPDEIAAILEAEWSAHGGASAAEPDEAADMLPPPSVKEAAQALAGRVWSVTFTARKPPP